MSITEGGIGNQNLLLSHNPIGKALGTLAVQYMLSAQSQKAVVVLGQIQRSEVGLGLYAHIGITVDGNIGNIMKQLVATVQCFREHEQLRSVVHKVRSIVALDEVLVLQHIFQELNIGLYAADTEFLQAAQHFGNSDLMAQTPGSGLNQKRIVVGSDNGASEGVTAVQTNAHAAAATIGNQLAGVGHKIVRGVLGSNTALNSMADGMQILLLGQGDFRTVQVVALSDLDLGLHDIDTGDLLGDGVLYLNTGVDLDEVEFAIRRCQKFYGAGADVVNILHQFHSGIANSLALLQRQGEGRGDFHQLLVTTLYGAITLEKMHQITVHIANDLHLDMLGVLQIFFQIDFIIAKGLLSFAFG